MVNYTETERRRTLVPVEAVPALSSQEQTAGEQATIIQQYLAEMARFPHLSDTEVCQLSQRIAQAKACHDRQAEASARQRLIEGLLSEVLPTAYRYAPRMRHLDLLDLIQEGNSALVRASHRFDFSNTTRPFGSYALAFIRGSIKHTLHLDRGIALSNSTFYKHRAAGTLDPILTMTPLSLNAPCREDASSDWQEVLAAPALFLSSSQMEDQVHEQIEQLLAILPRREQDVVRLRYGLSAQDGRTLDRAEVAQVLGLPASQVAHLETRALRRVREQVGSPQTLAGSQRMQRYHQQRHEDQQARLQATYQHFQRQGERITREKLARMAQVNHRAAGSFLHQQRGELPQTRQALSLSQEQRLEQGYAELVARGACLSVPRLKAVSHVGTTAARRFLRGRGIAPQWGKGRAPRKSTAVSRGDETVPATLA